VEVLDPRVAEIYRSMTPADRLAAAFEAIEFARAVARAGIREIHPEWSDVDVEAALAERTMGVSR
jgi:hypothetical protein